MRRARPADAAAIAAVHTRSWQAAYAHVFAAPALAGIDVERRRAWWERSIDEGGHAVLVAETGDGVVAFASAGASREDGSDGEVYAIYALPEAWGTGAGHGLMAAAVDALREAGFREATLWVLDDNPRARGFYEREGWAPDGATRTADVLGSTITEVRYRRSLEPAP